MQTVLPAIKNIRMYIGCIIETRVVAGKWPDRSIAVRYDGTKLVTGE